MPTVTHRPPPEVWSFDDRRADLAGCSPNIAECLLRAGEPGRTALCTIDQNHTYAQLRQSTAAIALWLARSGASPGDRAVLVGDNSLYWVAAYLGSIHAGLVSVPLPPSTNREDLEYALQTTGARIVFADAGFGWKHRATLEGCHLVTDRPLPATAVRSCHSFPKICDSASHHPAPPSVGGGGDLAALMFTSGSTGRPRGVMVSHKNIAANTRSIVQYLELTAADSIMTVLPFHYCFGTSLLHTHLAVGGTLVIEPRFMYPEVVLQRMIDTGCTGFAGVPSHFQLLLRRSSLKHKRFPALRYVQQAGGHLPPSSVLELCNALPDTRIFVMYGQTEATARLSYLPPELIASKPGSIGRGIPGVTLRVLDESGSPVRPGEVGEIVAEGDNVASGYWDAPDETAAVFRNGQLHTGDLATVDDEGFIFVSGRSKDFLKCAGKRVSCRQLEELVLRLDSVLEAAIVPMPDDVLGDAVKLFVVPRDPSADGFLARLHEHCRCTMLPPTVPREIVVLEALPKNPAGKVLKERLNAASGNGTVPQVDSAERGDWHAL